MRKSNRTDQKNQILLGLKFKYFGTEYEVVELVDDKIKCSYCKGKRFRIMEIPDTLWGQIDE